ncbi:lactococcin 972 family bacteriocin [Streptomyces sp. PSKA30]|uniref:lactococcin 972 family bacteriocin n=1 Tax=Streptomyces sp. PSKA30 TaxID=2874597 RepID=UPI001CD18B75|nr:lactococcin 972 family bacteriocin [Streptomyces sp. PSKA30]MBZ9644665.1 lactococcin 972 family bacteriocin [Streptomyces sp. PSKA30]
MVLAVFSFATPAVADSSQSATVTADGAIVAADGSQIGQVTHHKRGDGTKPPAELGNPSEWGVAALKVDDSAGSVTPLGCIGASGGTWCYGNELTTDGKYCYSNYYHGSKSHKSSVKIAGTTFSSGWVAKGNTSYANWTAGTAYTCYSIE